VPQARQPKPALSLSVLGASAFKPLTKPVWPLTVRIYACILEQCFRFQSQLAAGIFPGRYEWDEPTIIPLTSNHIIELLRKSSVEQKALLTTTSIRKALADLQKEGLITRVVLNCSPANLHLLTLERALKLKKVKKLSSLTMEQRSKVSRRTAIYLKLQAKPK